MNFKSKNREKKRWTKPKLVEYGSLEQVTSNALKLGSGDAFMSAHSLPDVLAQVS